MFEFGRLRDGTRQLQSHLGWLAAVLLLSAMQATQADVSGMQATDVTTRAFSVLWFSDEAVTGYELRVFDDADGLTEVTADLVIEKLSGDEAKALGLIKVDVTGLEPGRDYYVQSVTESATGPYTAPADVPLLAVTTATRTTRTGADDRPITNDLILHPVYEPGGVSPALGGLLLVRVPAFSDYPLTAFIDPNIDPAAAIVDLNNLFDRSTGASAQTSGGELLQVVEVRGLVGTGCTQADHKLTHSRKVPPHEEDPAITELETPTSCFSPNGVAADFNCNGRVGFSDFTDFARQFGTQAPNCAFNADFDIGAVPDGAIGGDDLERLTSVFGQSE